MGPKSNLPDSSAEGERVLHVVQALGLPTIGTSAMGLAISGARFGSQTGPCVTVVGGVHGNEPSSVVGVVELIDYLQAHTPASGSVFVVPVLNPDGILRNTKDNARGVDLNRNFGARNFSTHHPPGYFPGAKSLSESETAAFAAAVATVNPARVVAVHAPFACINFDGPAESWASRVAAACGWPARADIGYPTAGSLGSWLGVDGGLPVLTIEFPGGPYENFRDQARAALQTAINPDGIR